MSFVFFETHIFFDDKTLQLPLHLSKLIMNGTSTGFKSEIVGQTMHGPSFKDIFFFQIPKLGVLKIH